MPQRVWRLMALLGHNGSNVICKIWRVTCKRLTTEKNGCRPHLTYFVDMWYNPISGIDLKFAPYGFQSKAFTISCRRMSPRLSPFSAMYWLVDVKYCSKNIMLFIRGQISTQAPKQSSVRTLIIITKILFGGYTHAKHFYFRPKGFDVHTSDIRYDLW